MDRDPQGKDSVKNMGKRQYAQAKEKDLEETLPSQPGKTNPAVSLDLNFQPQNCEKKIVLLNHHL